MLKKLTYLVLLAIALVAPQFGNAQITYNTQMGVLDSLHSDILNESRSVYVQLPDSYDPDSSIKYPVVYILDGDVLLNALYTVHSFYSGGFMPEMIMVGISNGENRTRDLTTSVIDPSLINEENGGADKFMNFIEKELIPFIETKYPVTDYRTLIGHSYGGLFTINALLNHSHLFQNYLAIDPSMDWDDQKLLKQSKEVFAKEKFSNKSLFMSLSGQLHPSDKKITIDNVMKDTTDLTLFSRSIIEFSDVIKNNQTSDLTFEWEFYPNDLHGTVPLPSIMDGLVGLFTWFQMENVEKFNDFETPNDVLYKIIKHREEKLKLRFGYAVAPYPDFLLNVMGYMSLDMGKPEKSLMFFELNTEYYPEDANAYDSLADYYVSQNDYKNALINVTKAYELSGSDYHKKRVEEYTEKQ